MSEIAEYLDDRNMGNLETMSLDEYKYHLEHEHFYLSRGMVFWLMILQGGVLPLAKSNLTC